MASQPAASVDAAGSDHHALMATQMEVGKRTAVDMPVSEQEEGNQVTVEVSAASKPEERATPEPSDEIIEPASSMSNLQAAKQYSVSEVGASELQAETTPATTKEEMPEHQISLDQSESTSAETATTSKGQNSSPPPAADIMRRTISPAPPAVTAEPVEVKTQQADAVVGSPAQATLLDSVMAISSNTASSPPAGGDTQSYQSRSEQGQLPIRQSSHPAPWSPTLSGSTPTLNTAGPSSSSTTLPPHSPASLPGNSPPSRLLHHQQHPSQHHQAGPSRRAATTTGVPTSTHHRPNLSSSSTIPTPLTPTLPSTSSTLPTAEARDAIIASMSNLLDHKLQTRATQLHANSSALSKQEADIIRATDSLRKETGKLEKVARDAGKKVKELGNVQNWAEVLERDLLVIEETIRLANARGGDGSEDEEEGSERCSDCEGSCCWSGSESGSESGSGSDDEHDENGDERAKRRRTGGEELGDGDGPSMMKFGGVNVEINDDLLASLSEAMRLDIYEDDKNDGNSFGDPTDSGISVATPTSSDSLDRSQGTPSQGNSSIDSRLEPV